MYSNGHGEHVAVFPGVANLPAGWALLINEGPTIAGRIWEGARASRLVTKWGTAWWWARQCRASSRGCCAREVCSTGVPTVVVGSTVLAVVGKADSPTIRSCEILSVIGVVKCTACLCVVGDSLRVGYIKR